MKFSKKISFISFIIFISSFLFAFDWPVDVSSGESQIKTNFAENRGNAFSKGFVFSSSEDVKASEDGVVLVHINPENNYYENFTSTLGNSLILIHKDEMISALDPIAVESLLKGTNYIKTIPYTIKRIPNQDDNRFFLKEIPKKGGYYNFEGRGLGKGNFENYIVMFVNSKYIFFIGKIEKT